MPPRTEASARHAKRRTVAERHLHSVPAPAVRIVIDAAQDAFLAGDFALCHALLAETVDDRADPGRAMLVRARLARAENRTADVYACASEAARLHPGRDGRLAAIALQRIAAAQLGLDEEARRLQDALDREGDERLPALARYLLAGYAWGRDEYERATILARMNIAAGEQVGESQSLLGWIEHRQGRSAQAIAHFRESLATLRDDVRSEQRFRALTLAGFAGTVSELLDVEHFPDVRSEFDTIAWTSGLLTTKFQIVMALRQIALVDGDRDRVWILARDAIAIAPTRGYRAIAETFGAMACRLIGDRAAAKLHFGLAWEILRGEAWGEFDADERFALTYFAAEAASDMRGETQKALTIYRSLTAKESPLLMMTDTDPRVSAYASLAFGRVAEANGDARSAVAFYGDSLRRWNDVGYVYRAALIANDLLRLTRDEAYREPIDAVLSRAPRAWFPDVTEPPSAPARTRRRPGS